METSHMEWDVINPIFCLEESKNCSLVSPEFSTKSLKWKLILKVDRNEDRVSLFMEHDASKWELCRTLLSYTFNFEHDSVFGGAVQHPCIHLASQRGGFVGFSTYTNLKKRFAECRELHLILKMTAYMLSPGPNPTLMFTEPPPGFKELSDDLQNLYESGRFRDLVIKLKDGEILSHKAILAARSRKFAQKLEAAEAEISFDDHTVDEFKLLLWFLYTGKLKADMALTRDWPRFCEFVQSFDITEINQSRHSFNSAIRVLKVGISIALKTYVFVWEFPDYSKLQGTIESTPRTAFSGSKWKSEIEIGNNSIGVFLRKIGGITEPNRIAKLTVMLLKQTDADEALVPQFMLTKYVEFPNADERIGFQTFISRKDLNQMTSKVLQNDCLKICCQIVLSDGDAIYFQSGSIEWCVPSIYARISFCSDFATLLASGAFSDMTVAVQDKRINVHRSVLAARSPVFASIFKEFRLNTHFTLKFSSISPETLELLMLYIYTGAIGATCGHSLIELYFVAEKYSMADLKWRCSRLLGHLVNTYYAPIFLAMADECNDSLLKQSIIHFISKNISTVIASSNWRLLIDYSDSLAREVLKEVSPSRTYGETRISSDTGLGEDINETLSTLAI